MADPIVINYTENTETITFSYTENEDVITISMNEAARGPAGPAGSSAPSGTGYVKVLNGTFTTPGTTIPAADITGLGGAAVLNVGTIAGTVAAGDAAPNSHASSHAAAGSDPVTLTLAQISDAGDAASKTTSTGGNSTSDSGKVAIFKSDGSINSSAFVSTQDNGISGCSFTEGLITRFDQVSGVFFTVSIPSLGISSNTVTFRDLSGTVALTSDINETNVGAALGATVAIPGAKTWSGQQQGTGQSYVDGNSFINGTIGDARYPVKSLAFRTTDLSRQSTTKLADDSVLILPLAAGSVYEISAVVEMTSGATPGSKLRMFFSSSLDGANAGNNYGEWSTNGATWISYTITLAGVGATDVRTVASTRYSYKFRATIRTALACNVSIQWAQNTSDASNTTIGSSSYLQVIKIH